MEWFDFGVYGFLAYVLGKVFFPDASPSIQLIASLATFSVPFIVRPLGGLFFGMLGDKYGRKKVLAVTIVIMAVSTFCIGLIPSYATIGIWAPILLLIAKLAQGFSVGGEYTGAAIFVAEYSPDNKRGFLGSWLDFGSIIGFLLGAGIVASITGLLGDQRLEEWGWRIPFLIAGPLGLIGLYLRHSIEETPTFKQHIENTDASSTQNTKTKMPLKNVVQNNWKSLIICIGLVIATNVNYYMLLTYMPSYLTHNLHYSTSRGVLIIIAVMCGMLFIQPLIGLLSDRYGRKLFIVIGSLGLLFLSIPSFYFVQSGSITLTLVGLLILAILLNCFTGVMASILPSIFPTAIRYSAMAIAFNVSVLLAGFTPTAVAWLVEATSNLYMPAYYLMVVAMIGLATGIGMKETANKPLKGAMPAASSEEEAQEILQAHYETIEEKIEVIDNELEKLQQKRDILINQHPEIEK